MSNTYKTEEETYKEWYSDAVKNRGLIDIKFQVGDIKLTSKEEFYREANHFNSQADHAVIKPLYQVAF